MGRRVCSDHDQEFWRPSDGGIILSSTSAARQRSPWVHEIKYSLLKFTCVVKVNTSLLILKWTVILEEFNYCKDEYIIYYYWNLLVLWRWIHHIMNCYLEEFNWCKGEFIYYWNELLFWKYFIYLLFVKLTFDKCDKLYILSSEYKIDINENLKFIPCCSNQIMHYVEIYIFK